jgi:hypothetical protein
MYARESIGPYLWIMACEQAAWDGLEKNICTPICLVAYKRLGSLCRRRRPATALFPTIAAAWHRDLAGRHDHFAPSWNCCYPERDRMGFVPDTAFHRVLYRFSGFLPHRIAESTPRRLMLMYTQWIWRRTVQRLIREHGANVLPSRLQSRLHIHPCCSGSGRPLIIGPIQACGFCHRRSFQELNGYRFHGSEKTAATAMLELAAGTLDEAEYCEFLRANVTRSREV